MTVASASNPLSKGDHALKIVDDVASAIGQQDPPGGNIEGYGPVGQNVVYLEKGTNYSRTGPHELGHSSGLAHIKDLMETLPSGKTRPYTTDSFPGNLMHQSQDMNSQGQPAAGYSIESFQVKEMYRLYKAGALNRGRQQ
ncbi:hypothetical protein [Arcticibacter sp. MXS-1]|uniref:hypothetical protein n=1 Tax=Arcticibacter sp. MXS-1 TaxID=3341726 RepID=UPI0035A8F187